MIKKIKFGFVCFNIFIATFLSFAVIVNGQTPTPSAPVITNPTASSISATSAILNSSITSTGGANVTARGFNYGPTTGYGSTFTQSSGPYSTGAFSQFVPGLVCGTTYNYRSFATNAYGTRYSSNATFTTSACPTPSATPNSAPTVSTGGISGVNNASATFNGNITSTGGVSLTVSRRGFQYGESTYTDSVCEDGSFTTGAYSRSSGVTCGAVTATALSCGKNYIYRSFATNAIGTSYGSQSSFSTPACPTPSATATPEPTATPVQSATPNPSSNPTPGGPTVNISSATSVGNYTASLNGNITNLNGFAVSTRGFNYGLDTSYGQNISQSNGPYNTGAYSLTATSLSCDTRYYFRAFATNSAGTSYSNGSFFVTEPCPTPSPTSTGTPTPTPTPSATPTPTPTATVTPPPAPPVISLVADSSNITRTSVTLSGSITSGSATERGFEYGLNQLYGTVAKQNGGYGTGPFSLNISGLSPGLKYHFRSYAKNAGGASSSTDATFTTNPLPGNLSGWAWSSTIGWVNLNSVAIDPITGDLNGYAWSSNIGWIQFGNLANFPPSGAYAGNANINLDTGEVKGWAKALSGIDNIAGGGAGGGGGLAPTTGASCTWGTSEYLFSAEPEVYKTQSHLNCQSQPVASVNGNPSCPNGDLFAYPTYHSCPGSYRLSYGPPNTTLGVQQINQYATELCGAGNYTLPSLSNWSEGVSRSITCKSPSFAGGNSFNLDDGWDGWIELAGVNHPSIFPPKIVNGVNVSGVHMNITTGILTGMAWGGNVVGWLSFNASTSTNLFSASCSGTNLQTGKVRFGISASGGSNNYEYNWNNTGVWSNASSTFDKDYANNGSTVTVPVQVREVGKAEILTPLCSYTPSNINITWNGNPTCTVSPNVALVGNEVTANVVGNPLPQSTYRYTWLWGDSQSTESSDLNPITHIYEQPGNYQVTLNVVDVGTNSANKGGSAQFLCNNQVTVKVKGLDLRIGASVADIQAKNSQQNSSYVTRKGRPFRLEWDNTLDVYNVATMPDGYKCVKNLDNNIADPWVAQWLGNNSASGNIEGIANTPGTYKFSVKCVSDAYGEKIDSVILKVFESDVKEI